MSRSVAILGSRNWVTVSYGWAIYGPYAHVVNGSIIRATFRGPFALQRAIRRAERLKKEGESP